MLDYVVNDSAFKKLLHFYKPKRMVTLLRIKLVFAIIGTQNGFVVVRTCNVVVEDPRKIIQDFQVIAKCPHAWLVKTERN